MGFYWVLCEKLLKNKDSQQYGNIKKLRFIKIIAFLVVL
jgi:hypothetical protein